MTAELICNLRWHRLTEELKRRPFVVSRELKPKTDGRRAIYFFLDKATFISSFRTLVRHMHAFVEVQ